MLLSKKSSIVSRDFLAVYPTPTRKSVATPYASSITLSPPESSKSVHRPTLSMHSNTMDFRKRGSIYQKHSSMSLRSSISVNEQLNEEDEYLGLEGNALFCLSYNFCVRKWLFDLSKHHYFEHSIIFLILVSSIMLCVDSPFYSSDGNASVTI